MNTTCQTFDQLASCIFKGGINPYRVRCKDLGLKEVNWNFAATLFRHDILISLWFNYSTNGTIRKQFQQFHSRSPDAEFSEAAEYLPSRENTSLGSVEFQAVVSAIEDKVNPDAENSSGAKKRRKYNYYSPESASMQVKMAIPRQSNTSRHKSPI